MKPCSLETLIVAGSGSRPRSPTGNTLKPSSAGVVLNLMFSDGQPELAKPNLGA